MEEDKTIPIAVIGLGCRFPGDAKGPEDLFKMCAESRTAWAPIRKDRFDLDGYYHPDSNRAGAVSRDHFNIVPQAS